VDGPAGTASRVIIDPAIETVTHLVIEPKHWLGVGRLVPLDLVDTTEGGLSLRCTVVEDLPPADRAGHHQFRVVVVARVKCVPGELLTITSLNTRGIPLTGSQLAERYAAIGDGFDAGDADVVCCQEVFTYWHLRLLVRRMRSFRQVSYWRAPFGPAGGLVTFSRRPVSGTAYRRFGRPPRAPGVPRRSRFQAWLKGALVTRLARPELCVINTHPVANYDGDWSEANRFYPLHRAQFAVLARVVNEAGPRAVVCGDFNLARESNLFGEFTAATGLADAFAGACPPTFRAEYLPPGAAPHCIDFILTAAEVKADSAGLVFAEKKEPLGYVSDHIGLRAQLSLTPRQ